MPRYNASTHHGHSYPDPHHPHQPGVPVLHHGHPPRPHPAGVRVVHTAQPQVFVTPVQPVVIVTPTPAPVVIGRVVPPHVANARPVVAVSHQAPCAVSRPHPCP